MQHVEMSIAAIREILAPIPAEEWIRTRFTDGRYRCCAVGHLQRLLSPNPEDYSHENCTDKSGNAERTNIRLKSMLFLTRLGVPNQGIAEVNNGECHLFTQLTCKERVMKLLNMMCREEEYLLAREAERLKVLSTAQYVEELVEA